VHELVAKLTELDPDAGMAMQVIGRFDTLIEGRAGLEPILGAVAVLTHTPPGWSRRGTASSCASTQPVTSSAGSRRVIRGGCRRRWRPAVRRPSGWRAAGRIRW
jgi:hypothetical protein